MELTPEQQVVLDILKEHDVEKGEYLSVLTVEREGSNLPKETQDNWNDFTYLQIDVAQVPVGVHKLTVTVRDVRTAQAAERNVLFRVIE